MDSRVDTDATTALPLHPQCMKIGPRSWLVELTTLVLTAEHLRR